MGGSVLDLHHLRYFVAVAQHRSFTKAAEACRVAQPSLSQQIKRLEEILGVVLFDRSGGPVRLTDAGKALLPRAEEILAQAEDAVQTVREVRGLRRGRLVVGTLPWTASRILPPLVAEFRVRYPGIHVVLREESTAALTELTLRGETDVTLTTLPVREDALAIQEVLTEDILLAVPRNHPLAYQPTVDLSEFRKEPFMLMKQGYGFRELAVAGCRSVGFEPKVAYESAQMETILSLVAVGLGVSLVPRMATDRERIPSPVYLEIARPRLTRTLALVWRKDKYLSGAARAFLEVARATWPVSAHAAAGEMSPES